MGRKCDWLRRASTLLSLMMIVVACASEDRRDPDDAFIAPTGDNAELGEMASEPARDSAGAGDPGTPMDSLETIFFAFDSSVVSGAAQESLQRNANWLRDNPRATVQIEGHCDERGTVEYNLALGERRAAAARSYMEKLGVEKSRLSIISLGEERSLDPGHDETAWGKNRRAEFVATNLN